MKLEAGKVYRRSDGRLVQIHEILVQQMPAAVVGMANDGQVPVQVLVAIGRAPDIRGRLYYFAETGLRVGSNSGFSDLVDLDESDHDDA